MFRDIVNNKNFLKWLLISLLFVFYFVVALHKLTYSSLWYDETIEYFFSKYFFSSNMPFSDSVSTYQRLLSALQPPLYNFIMFFWLKISESEFWFRLFGVIAGSVTLLGVYKTVNLLLNYKISVFVCAFMVCLYNFIYSCQECAEYNLMLIFATWCLYFFVKILDEKSIKNITYFVLFACFAVGTQYGSAFLVFGLAVVLFIKSLIEKDYSATKKLSLAYLLAIIFAAFPLYIFFFRYQILREDIVQSVFKFSLNQSNFFVDIWKSFFNSIYYIFSCHNNLEKLRLPFTFVFSQFIMVYLFIISLFFSLFKSEDKRFKYLNISFLVVWFLYYLGVKSGFYSYGKFMGRYELFIYPLAVIVFGISIYSVINLLLNSKIHKYFKIISLAIICILFTHFSIYELKFIERNWQKENQRGLVDYWYSHECYKKPSIIYYGLSQGFGYYFLQDKRYKKEYENTLYIQPGQRAQEISVYKEYFKTVFNGNYPESFYFCVGHNRSGDVNIISAAFMSFGYEAKIVYFSKEVSILLFTETEI